MTHEDRLQKARLDWDKAYDAIDVPYFEGYEELHKEYLRASRVLSECKALYLTQPQD